MSARSEFERIARRARREALAVIVANVRAALPKGWRCVLAVGWGVTVFDDQERMTEAEGVSRSHGMSPHKRPAKLRHAVKLAEDFGDVFGLGNEEICA